MELEAKRALELAPRLSEAHAAMGFVQRFLHHDFAASRDEFQQAVDLRPNDSDALLNLAVADSNLGNLDAAIKAMRRAIALDPQESGYHYLLGMMLAAARSEEHTSELQSLMRISYAVFCLKKKNTLK